MAPKRNPRPARSSTTKRKRPPVSRHHERITALENNRVLVWQTLRGHSVELERLHKIIYAATKPSSPAPLPPPPSLFARAMKRLRAAMSVLPGDAPKP